MLFDYKAYLTAQNTPWRWRALAKYLVETKPDYLANLYPDLRDMMQFIYNKDFGDLRAPAAPVMVVASKTANSVTFNVDTLDANAAVLLYGMDDHVYGTGTPTAPAPATDISASIASGLFIKSGLTAGHAYAFKFKANDPEGTGTVSVEQIVVLAPAAPAPAAAAAGAGQLALSAPAVDGAVSYTFMYLNGAGHNQAEVLAGGAVVNGATTVNGLTPGNKYSVIAKATNPGGDSPWSDSVDSDTVA